MTIIINDRDIGISPIVGKPPSCYCRLVLTNTKEFMSIPFRYSTHTNEQHYLSITVEGIADDIHIENMYADIKNIALQNQYKNILVNANNVTLDFPMERFLPLMNRLLPQLVRFNIARLCSLDDYKQDLIQNVCLSSNVNMKNFTNQTDAENWLLEQYP